jgi:hypothetical protein
MVVVVVAVPVGTVDVVVVPVGIVVVVAVVVGGPPPPGEVPFKNPRSGNPDPRIVAPTLGSPAKRLSTVA